MAQYTEGTPVTIYYRNNNTTPTANAFVPQTIPAIPDLNTIMSNATSLTVNGASDTKHIIGTLESRIEELERLAVGG